MSSRAEHLLASVCAIILTALPARPASSETELAALLGQSATVIRHGRVAYQFVDLDSGSVLAERDAEASLAPASNMKLYTTALALTRLGPDYRFRTELRTDGSFQRGQPKTSDLFVVGGGDPNLSGRKLPYQVDSTEGDPLAPLKDLAGRLFDSGIREISGDVIGVATRYPGDPFPDGWTIDDSYYTYGAPITSLAFNDNTVSLILRPTEMGELAELEIRPAQTGFIVLNQVVTDASDAAHVQFRRTLGSNEIVLWGAIPVSANRWREDFAMYDPARAAAQAMIEILREHGIKVQGEARSKYGDLNDSQWPEARIEAGTILATRESAPLAQAIQVVNKVSQNLHAEMMLREVAFARTGLGTLENGRKERDSFLRAAGVNVDGMAAKDGSGLSRSDLTTPKTTVELLRYMWGRPEREAWLHSLPIGAVDGSLEHRFRRIAGAQRVHAKTGSLSHVNALSGYLETKSGRWVAFSVMVNGTVSRDSAVREFIDRLCAVFLNL